MDGEPGREGMSSGGTGHGGIASRRVLWYRPDRSSPNPTRQKERRCWLKLARGQEEATTSAEGVVEDLLDVKCLSLVPREHEVESGCGKSERSETPQANIVSVS